MRFEDEDEGWDSGGVREEGPTAKQLQAEEAQRSNIAKLRQLGSVQQLGGSPYSSSSPHGVAASSSTTTPDTELFVVIALDKNKKKTSRKGFLVVNAGRLMYLKDTDKVFFF